MPTNTKNNQVISPKEDRCIKESMEFIRNTAEKYSLRSFTGAPNEKGVAANALIGDIAFARYKACMER